jgi:hypothetical protein
MANNNVEIEFVNEYLKVFNLNLVKDLNDTPELDKKLFDTNLEILKPVVSKYIKILKMKYDSKSINYYDRSKIKDYPRILLFKILELNGIKYKGQSILRQQEKNTYKTIYCYRRIIN